MKEKAIKDTPFRTESYLSYNYTQFKMGTNRKIRKAHLNNLINSINKKGFIPQFRVLVTKSGFIIDGQHRLLAAMETKKGYYYEVCDLSTDIIAMLNNLQLKWKGIDYVEYYAYSKKKSYVDLLNVINEFSDFSYASIISTLNNSGVGVAPEIADGSFVFDTKPKTIKILTALNSFSEYIPHSYKTRSFVRAFTYFYNRTKFYNNDNMLDRIRKNKTKFTKGNEASYFLQLLTEIY